MAARVARIYKGSPVLNVYELDDSFRSQLELNINFGDETSPKWGRFVRNNRSRSFFDFSRLECKHDNKYDIVIGPIADDDMAMLFRQYEKRNELF